MHLRSIHCISLSLAEQNQFIAQAVSSAVSYVRHISCLFEFSDSRLEFRRGLSMHIPLHDNRRLRVATVQYVRLAFEV